jgi:hypothetical protein
MRVVHLQLTVKLEFSQRIKIETTTINIGCISIITRMFTYFLTGIGLKGKYFENAGEERKKV